MTRRRRRPPNISAQIQHESRILRYHGLEPIGQLSHTAMRTLVEMVQSRHTDRWAERHARGEVPDAWPYGLNRLAAHGIEPVWSPRRAGLAEGLGRAVTKAAGVRLLEGWTAPARSIDARLCWDERTGIPAALDRRTRGISVVSGTIWATDPEAPKRVRMLLRAALQRQDLSVFANSLGQLTPLREMTPARVQYLPFGVDPDFWRASEDPDPRSRMVVSAGNDRHRDFGTLIGGALKDPRNRLTLASSAQISDVNRLEVGPRTHVQLRGLFYDANVVSVATHPNDHCSGLTTTLEAMSCGRPVVATRTPGMEDYVDDGVTGILVPPGDAEALAAAVGQLLDDPARARAMGAAGAERVRDRFTTEHLASALAGLLKEATTRG